MMHMFIFLFSLVIYLFTAMCYC